MLSVISFPALWVSLDAATCDAAFVTSRQLRGILAGHSGPGAADGLGAGRPALLCPPCLPRGVLAFTKTFKQPRSSFRLLISSSDGVRDRGSARLESEARNCVWTSRGGAGPQASGLPSSSGSSWAQSSTIGTVLLL